MTASVGALKVIAKPLSMTSSLTIAISKRAAVLMTSALVSAVAMSRSALKSLSVSIFAGAVLALESFITWVPLKIYRSGVWIVGKLRIYRGGSWERPVLKRYHDGDWEDL